MRNATPPCLDTFCRLGRLGLSVTAQRVEPDHTVLRCRPTTPPLPCPGCARPGVRHDAVLRRLVHVPLGWKPTILEVVVPRYRCWPCRRIWRHSITTAAPSKGKLSREVIMVAVTSIVVTWNLYQSVIEAYQANQPAEGKKIMARLITSVHSGVPAGLEELRLLGQTMKQHRDDILAFFDLPGTSNGPTEAVNGLLEHLRGTAKGFRNIVTYIARCLLDAGGFKPLIHSLL